MTLNVKQKKQKQIKSKAKTKQTNRKNSKVIIKIHLTEKSCTNKTKTLVGLFK